MADKGNDGPPPLEDPNSPDYICVVCQNNVDALCQECQETAELRANSTRNDSGGEDDKLSETSNSAYDGETIRDDSDRDTKNPSIPLDIDDESRSYVGHMILHEDPESPVTTRSNSPKAMSASGTSDSAYSADTIIDSPTSTDTTVDVNDIDLGAENNLNYNCDEPHIIQNFDESCLLYPPCCCHIPNPSEDSDDEI